MINGEGIDRHLLGLKFIALENKIEVPELLRDEVHENTTYWKISTSQVSAHIGKSIVHVTLAKLMESTCFT